MIIQQMQIVILIVVIHMFLRRAEYEEYPQSVIRTDGRYNIPAREADAVMYDSFVTEFDPTLGAPPAICGMVTKTDPCTLTFSRDNFTESFIAMDYVPNELSFDYQYSDTWFSYLYDTSDEAGHIGKAAYHLETRAGTTTTTTPGTPATGNPGDPGYDPGSPGASSSTSEDGVRCIPCTNFTCTPAKTILKYTTNEDLTGDKDCPHPTLFAIDTESLKVAFSYDQFSSQLPNGAIDFEVSYDGVTYADAWDVAEESGIEYTSSQNPWSNANDGDAGFTDFEIFDINDGANAVDLRLKFRIEAISDSSGATTVYNGTRWILTEVLSNGTGFSVGQVFPLSTQLRLADNSLVTFTINLKIAAVGPVSVLSGGDPQDIMRVGDTLNGHRINRTFHTEIGEFPYHVAYLDGNGNDFTKDTQYTSSRNHVITAVAGYGIVDRAILIGMYEFLDKSLQYVTGDVNQEAPDIFNSISTPLAFISLNENGGISDVNIDSGVFSFSNKSFEDLNVGDERAGYSTGVNIATTGGTGSGLTVDIDVTIIDGNDDPDEIGSVRVNTPGTGYVIGDIVTISGGSARIQVLEVTHGGSNLDKLDSPPDMGITCPADSDTGLRNTSTQDGNPEFKLELTTEKLSFEIVTKDEGVDVEPISDEGGNNEQAVIKGDFTGGSLSSIEIIKPGKGYNVENRPQLVINNQYQEITSETSNAGYSAEGLDNIKSIVESIPTGSEGTEYEVKVSPQDLQAIDDSYNSVPQSLTTEEKAEPMFIKTDPEEDEVYTRGQRLYTKEQTDPLYTQMVPKYDTSYLDLSDFPADFKKAITDTTDTIENNVVETINNVTQEVYPEETILPATKAQANIGSFSNLPTATQFTKYIMRQYRADTKEREDLTVTLSCTPVNIGTSHFTCNTPLKQQDTSTTTTDDEGNSVTETNIYTMNPAILGPGCQPWEASGKLTVLHDFSKSARTVGLAAQAFGNPFAD
ncbi:structural protein [Synechococcus phage S-CAM22]|uniref:Structural protein n=1 Tax=Synechococcus phage S-CAM22 TaxID=1883365 RepID=A0A1D8KRK7_9CAUD|nr:baseplate wedge subunit [Synechococcus phage S-CAM22]AOV61333.1 structural protein [Synechococcus phage S-CAM22]